MEDYSVKEIISSERIIAKIYLIRGIKVMLDKDLAELYEVETSQLKRQVRRNIDRFPDDFMFELSEKEFENLICQIGTSSWGGTRYLPMAFTEQGVAMLASVLNSNRAIQVNIQIVRAFVQLRRMISSHEDLRKKIEAIEKKCGFHAVFDRTKKRWPSVVAQTRVFIGYTPGRGGGMTRSWSGNCEGKRTTRPLPLALLITAAPHSPEGLSGVTRANLLRRIRPQSDARIVSACGGRVESLKYS